MASLVASGLIRGTETPRETGSRQKRISGVEKVVIRIRCDALKSSMEVSSDRDVSNNHRLYGLQDEQACCG